MPKQVQVLRCPACGTLDPGPRLLCANCGSPGLIAHHVSGAGTVASWTVIRRPPLRFRGEGPYAVAVIDLSAGVRVTGRLSRIPEDGLRPGAPVAAIGQSEQGIMFEEGTA
jgi:uncharacterized OB-fold protein